MYPLSLIGNLLPRGVFFRPIAVLKLLVIFSLGGTSVRAAENPSREVRKPDRKLTGSLDQRPQAWQRRGEAIISAETTKQPWCKVVVYSPRVALIGGIYRMWYCGSSTGSRSGDCSLGYAESKNGITWIEHDGNPIVRAEKIGWGTGFWNPCVRFDEEEKIYKMWFSSNQSLERDSNGRLLKFDMALGYATSLDGKAWEIHPEPIYESGLGPCVIKTGPGSYRMWMNSAEDRRSNPESLYQNIYGFDSVDGIDWQRDAEPAIQPTRALSSAVYPWVIRDGPRFLLWHGAHAAGGRFEIFAATSPDGALWTPNHESPAFPATGGREDFDGRYTSTPCVLAENKRHLLYYSSRDWKDSYRDAEGILRKDGSGVYAHLGVAVLPGPGKD